ncbi:MAG TPA: DUF2207 domain-containing protein [Steroidobacteraceae bacterium]|nr:DUF2207 domain-containing protein [Steroidobacteraceae bacterium]
MIRWLALALLLAAPVHADERFLNYGVDVKIQADGSLDVTETIKVRAEGSQIRRGIYRDFPTRYRDRYGNRVVVDLQVLDVERDGRPEPWFTENKANGVRINTGNNDFLPVPAEFEFRLHYRTTRQLGFFADHDELYWNAIGTGWAFPIDAGQVDVQLPSAVPIQQMSAEGYTGYQGSTDQNYVASLPAPGTAHWDLTAPLAPQQGLTIVLSFPKGIVHAPTQTQRAYWLLKDNRGLLIAALGLLALAIYCVREWRRVGRDPAAGVVFARYEPPQGMSPAALRNLRRMSYDTKCFTADVLALAVAGHLRIEHDKSLFKNEWRLVRTHTSDGASTTSAQKQLLDRLFQGGEGEIVLKNTNAAVISSARSGHAKALDRQLQPEYFKRNGGSVGKAFLIGLVGGGAGILFAHGSALPLILFVCALMAIALIVFAILIRAPTDAGRKLLDEIEGLKLYLSVAERTELANMPEPGKQRPVLDAKRYEMLLPFAVALEVEDAWTQKFTAAVGEAEALRTTQNIGWYHGGSVNNLGSLAHAVGSSLSSQIASASSPPGSSSGSGGGGSSGGGGGGGGGGGR